MTEPQAGILLPIPTNARYLSFDLVNPVSVPSCLRALRDLADGENTVVGFGLTLTAALDANIQGLNHFPLITAPGLSIERAPEAVWIWLRGDDRGELLHRSRRMTQALSPAFELKDICDAFKHDNGRDLSGYEDGTENPIGEEAVSAAIVGGASALAGSSFVAVQRWAHRFDRFEAMSGSEQDNTVGRRRTDNEELDDAPESAHVKRTAQESLTPEAFVLRRSMPWADGNEGGLMFVAFGRSFAAFEAQLNRMVGNEDGVVDALFKFTQPVSGAYYWCPAIRDGQLDLTQLGL